MKTIATNASPVLSKALKGRTRKRKVFVSVRDSVRCSGTYWDSGSRYNYNHLTRSGNLTSIPCPTAPPHFGGGEAPLVDVMEGCAIVQGGTSLGKPAMLHITIRKDDLEKWGLKDLV